MDVEKSGIKASGRDEKSDNLQTIVIKPICYHLQQTLICGVIHRNTSLKRNKTMKDFNIEL